MPEAGEYLSPRASSHLVGGVHITILADYADAGALRAVRTKGGHRRYLREDLLRLRAIRAASRNARVRRRLAERPLPPLGSEV